MAGIFDVAGWHTDIDGKNGYGRIKSVFSVYISVLSSIAHHGNPAIKSIAQPYTVKIIHPTFAAIKILSI
jgi:hypothetical protein